jgi:hypothetical protein
MLRLLLFSLLFYVHLNAGATNKPAVNVIFVIEEPRMKLNFFKDIRHLEDSIAESLIPELNKYLCFARFEQNGQLPDSFKIILHNIDRSDNWETAKDIFFLFELNGKNIKSHESSVSWLFMTKLASLNSFGKRKDFAAKVSAAFAGKLKFEYPALVENIFSNLAIANQGHFSRRDLEWILPFRRNDLGIGSRSLFEIVNEAKDHAGILDCPYYGIIIGHYIGGSLPPDYHQGIRLRNKEEDDLCGIFSNQNLNVKVKMVYLKSFDRDLRDAEDPSTFVPTSNQN